MQEKLLWPYFWKIWNLFSFLIEKKMKARFLFNKAVLRFIFCLTEYSGRLKKLFQWDWRKEISPELEASVCNGFMDLRFPFWWIHADAPWTHLECSLLLFLHCWLASASELERVAGKGRRPCILIMKTKACLSKIDQHCKTRNMWARGGNIFPSIYLLQKENVILRSHIKTTRLIKQIILKSCLKWWRLQTFMWYCCSICKIWFTGWSATPFCFSSAAENTSPWQPGRRGGEPSTQPAARHCQRGRSSKEGSASPQEHISVTALGPGHVCVTLD